jgi:F0F1-type ATP synthase assembly protein I
MSGPEGEKEDPGLSGRRNSLWSMGVLFGSGMQLAISVALMFFVGRWADERYHTAPWLLITGVLFGVGAGLYNFIRTAIGIDDRSQHEEPPRDDAH